MVCASSQSFKEAMEEMYDDVLSVTLCQNVKGIRKVCEEREAVSWAGGRDPSGLCAERALVSFPDQTSSYAPSRGLGATQAGARHHQEQDGQNACHLQDGRHPRHPQP